MKILSFFICFLFVGLGSRAQSTCRHRINALFPPVLPNNLNYADFNNYVLPQPDLDGVCVLIAWNSIESNTNPGVYNFATWDANLMHFQTAGKNINLIVAPANAGGSNQSTPTYVFGTAWANAVAAPNPQDVSYCSYYPGSGVFTNTVANINTPNFDNTGAPICYELPFKEAYKNFITALIQHYSVSNAAVPKIGYIRFGMDIGGEALALCHSNWPGYSQAKYLAYVHEMMTFIAAQNPSIEILADLNQVANNINYPDSEAYYAVMDGKMGFGTNGFQKSDLANYPSTTSDWANQFNLYKNQIINGDSITLSLQTLKTSDPTNNLPTGSLINLLPFAKQHGANNLEIYTCDLLLAYDPNYTSTNCNVLNPGYAGYAASYSQALSQFRAGCAQLTTQLNQNQISNAVSIFPNPFINETTVHITASTQETDSEFRIFDLFGKELRSYKIIAPNTKISRDNLPSGIYFYQVRDRERLISTGKLVAQ